MHPHVKKVVHFTDGAASQYKNCKNFTNLLFLKDDFGVEGEWHFLLLVTEKGLVMVLEVQLRDWQEEQVFKPK